MPSAIVKAKLDSFFIEDVTIEGSLVPLGRLIIFKEATAGVLPLLVTLY